MLRIILGVAIAFVTFLTGSFAASAWNSIRVEKSCELVMSHALTPPNVDSIAEQEIQEFFRQYGEAQSNHDVAYFKRVETDTFTLTYLSGESLNRSEAIRRMKTWDKNIQYSFEVMDVQLYGDVASAEVEMTTIYPDNQGSNNCRWLELLMKHNGQWRLLSTAEIYR